MVCDNVYLDYGVIIYVLGHTLQFYRVYHKMKNSFQQDKTGY